MAIKITTTPTTEPLVGKSHWWGFADLPVGVEYPVRGGADEQGYTADGKVRLLLQVGGDDRWGLRFFDMGTLCFLIKAEDLAAQRFERTKLMLYSS